MNVICKEDTLIYSLFFIICVTCLYRYFGCKWQFSCICICITKIFILFTAKKKNLHTHSHLRIVRKIIWEVCPVKTACEHTWGKMKLLSYKMWNKVFTVLITQKFSCRNPLRWKKHTFPIKSGHSLTHKFVSQGHCLESSFWHVHTICGVLCIW
jgi:hypothetical protein